MNCLKKFLIFDGNSIINRAFYGIRLLTNTKGEYTNAIYGFLNIFLKFYQEENPDYIAVAFDLKEKTFRHKMYDGYKAQRKGMPEELHSQMQPLKDILDAMNVTRLEKAGFEADDIIGTVAKRCEEDNVSCVIVTGDKDDLQLASDKTKIRLVVTKGGNTETTDYDEKAVIDAFSVTPTEFIAVKALMGDNSDNIPGVAGIGEKTAFSLINQYKSLDNLYEHTDELKGACQKKIIEGKDMAYLSYTLSKIDTEVPLDTKIEEMTIKEYNNDLLVERLSYLELKTIISRLDLKETQQKSVDIAFAQITSPEMIKVNAQNEISYILYTENEEVKGFYFSKDNAVYGKEFYNMMEFMPYLGVLKDIFENENIKKLSHSVKEDIVFLKRNFDIDYNGEIFDTQIASYILEPTRSEYNLNDLISAYCGVANLSRENIAGMLCSLKDTLLDKIKENNQGKLLEDIEFPLIKVLASMEIEGFSVDKQRLLEFSKMLSEKIEVTEKEIYSLAGEMFNINSPKQLGVVLFEKLNIPPVKKTKTGYSTNAEVLEKLAGKYEIARLIIEYRTYAKLKSTYADGLYTAIDERDGKIHSSFNQTVTATGRISSTEPNLQNIPVRLALGREIRKMFIASDGCVLTDADYSQIELRVLAHISGDEKMTNAFKSGEDIHTLTASQVFKVPVGEVSDTLRTRAKAVNFGIVYGIGEFSLAQDIKVSVKEAKTYIESYFENYPQIKEYLDKTVEFAREHGYVKTLVERRRYIPEIKSSNYNLRSFGERVAMNAPIQGYAADIIKIAMIKVFERLKKENLKSKLILQVHDELIVDTKIDETEKVGKILKEEMERAVVLSAPLPVEMKSGNSWYDTK